MKKDTLLTRLLRSLVRASFHSPWLVILALGVVGLGAGYTASKLAFRGDFIELLPESSDEVKDLRFVEARAGGGGYLVTQVLGGTAEQRRSFAAAVAPKLEEQRDLIRYVEYRFDMEFFRSRALLLLKTPQLTSLEGDLKERITWEKKHANPLFVDLLDEAPPADFDAIATKYGSEAPSGEFVESKDGKELYLYVKPTGLAGDLDFNRKLVAAARGVADATLAAYPGLTVAFTGPFVIRIEEDETMQRDLKLAGVIASVVALGVMLLATRKVVALLVSFAPVSLGIAITFAFAKVTIGHLNPVTGFLGAILVGLGIEYGIHLSMRYWEERAEHGVHEALENAVLGTFTGALTSAATNAVAFLVLMFAEFEAFKQFGRIAGFGVISTVLSAYLLAPAILVVAERVRPFRPRKNADGSAKARLDIPRIPTGAMLTVMALVAAFAAYSLSVVSQVSFESDLRRLKGESPATALDDHITAQLGLIMTPALLYVDTLEQAHEVAGIVEQVRLAGGEKTSFQKVASLNDMIPRDPAGHQVVIDRLKVLMTDLPESMKEGKTGQKVRDFQAMLEAKSWGAEAVPLEIRRRFTALSGSGTFVLLFPRYSGYDTNELDLWAKDLDDVVVRARAKGLSLHVLDGNRIASKIFRLIKKDGPFILFTAAVVVFLMIWLSLRSLRDALLVGGPLFLGMTCVFGGMHLLGLRLNFLNVVVLPNLLTIAVDNSVHLYHRYHEEGRGSMGHVWRTTGFAAIVATVSNAAGYGALLVAHHEGLRSVALLAVMGVFCTFMGTTVFFPMLVEVRERLRGPAPEPAKQGSV